MNILADFESAIQSINRFNNSIKEFNRTTLELATCYCKGNSEEYHQRVNQSLEKYSTRDIFLLLAFLPDETTLNIQTQKIKIDPRELLEKILIKPQEKKKNLIKNLIVFAMLNGYLTDKEIINYWQERGIFLKNSSVRYNTLLLLTSYGTNSRTQLLRRLMRDF